MQRGQKTINSSLEGVDANPQGWLWEVPDFNGGSNCRHGENSRRTRIRGGTWRHDWIAAISQVFNAWAEKGVSCDGKDCEDAVKMIKMTTKDRQYYINVVVKAVMAFE